MNEATSLLNSLDNYEIELETEAQNRISNETETDTALEAMA